MIESRTNSKIKYASKLKLKKYRTEYNQFLVEGRHLVEEAIKSGLIQTLFTTGVETYEGLEIIQVSEDVMLKLSELHNSESVIAICNKPDFVHLSKKVLILDGVQDPGNMGTLIRTAAAFGFHTIISENSVDYYNDKVIRSSQGAIFYVDLLEADRLEFLSKHSEYHIYGTDVLEGMNIKEINFDFDYLAIILGNEGNGVREEVKQLVHTNINIPMIATESLNVGIAGGIIMYEVFKGEK